MRADPTIGMRSMYIEIPELAQTKRLKKPNVNIMYLYVERIRTSRSDWAKGPNSARSNGLLDSLAALAPLFLPFPLLLCRDGDSAGGRAGSDLSVAPVPLRRILKNASSPAPEAVEGGWLDLS